MDPTEAWAAFKAPTIDFTATAHIALDLLTWLAKGGFPPKGESTNDVVDECAGYLAGTIDHVGART